MDISNPNELYIKADDIDVSPPELKVDNNTEFLRPSVDGYFKIPANSNYTEVVIKIPLSATELTSIKVYSAGSSNMTYRVEMISLENPDVEIQEVRIDRG